MLKNCSICGVAVDRTDCHKNRHGEYICRSCQAAGIKMTHWRQLKGTVKKLWTILLPVLMRISLIVFGLWLLLKILVAQDT